MTIKSLLLGSAVALAGVQAAAAADAIFIPEPEPVEYVRVCDAYGAGFFYIPGTETCLQISGYVWYQIGATNERAGGTPNYLGAIPGGWNKSTRARLNIDARSDTEWGTLRSYIRLQGDWDAANQFLQDAAGNFIPQGGDGNLSVDQAFIQLGGLYMGYTESAFYSTLNGGSSYNGSHSDGGLYTAFQQRQQIGYNFTGAGGFHATLALEHDGNSNYMPDVVAVVGLEQGWGGVWAKVGYDEDLSPTGGVFPEFLAASGVDGFAATLGAQFNIPNMTDSSLRVQGYWSENNNVYSVGSRWSVVGSYYHQFTPNFGASVGAQYFNDTDFAVPGSPDAWSAELSLIWTPVENFEVRTEVYYDKAEGASGTTSGFLRFTRFF